MKQIDSTITEQGGPVLNHAYILAAGDDVIAVGLDMQSKYCEVFSTGGTDGVPCLLLVGGENGLHLKAGRELEPTEIEFPTLKDWSIWSSDVSRYTVHICFVKDKKES